MQAVSFPGRSCLQGRGCADAVTAENAFFEKRSEAKQGRLASSERRSRNIGEGEVSRGQLQATTGRSS
ncbi:hypothetical protein F2981_22420 (plasmid) [Sinorhizobium meliloti]|nr:hypothetical protein [Sinorhizobium meliloti]